MDKPTPDDVTAVANLIRSQMVGNQWPTLCGALRTAIEHCRGQGEDWDSVPFDAVYSLITHTEGEVDPESHGGEAIRAVYDAGRISLD